MLLSVFTAVLLISNIVAPKMIEVFGYKISGALLLFPVTYIFGDIFTEVYGYAGSRRAIWSGFLGLGLYALVTAVVVNLPPARDWPHQAAYETVLGSAPRIAIGSLIAYWAGEFANSFVMSRMKVRSDGKNLWQRTIGSTVVGQLVDTIIVVIAVFGPMLDWTGIAEIVRNQYIFKVLYEAVATPVTYWVVNTLKRAEGLDILDKNVDYTPFQV